MFASIYKKVFGSSSDREIKKISPVVDKINSLEAGMEQLDLDALRALTDSFRARLKEGQTLEDILPEAFAAVREVARRKLNMRHFDVQLIGGVVLNEGNISEMKTGEGKTLVATLPLYLNALVGKGAHLVTVNDYLARRDAQWMGPIYHTLGLTLGILQHDRSFIYDPEYQSKDKNMYYLREVSRREAYGADITYGTNNEYGFDYLRDNMKFTLDEYVQRDLFFAIVDEVDSILIDEARTPLIISGPTEDSTDKYYTIDRVIPGLNAEEHYTIDEKGKQVFLTDDGVTKLEGVLEIENLYDPRNLETLHHIVQALHAHVLKHVDVDYVVNDGQVIIVDEFTGRLMEGRRWSDGLHQAVEAKEGVTIENENQTLASITFQNFFRMYDKLSGMTGTAETEALEFRAIYGLDVVVIPTNKELMRKDPPDLIYKTGAEKFRAVIRDIEELRETGRPVLVGTISIEDSEKLSKMLKQAGLKHNVLNAKQHEREAYIVAQAGRIGSVTLSTNMAGRGTDIVLGGNPEAMASEKAPKDDTTGAYAKALEEATIACEAERQEVLALGGLHIVGTERHESRRIDNQLRGRAGRQGDPGSTRFYLSLEDDLMRIFGSERIGSIMDRLGMDEDTPIEHSIVSRAVEGAQKKVEAHNFDIRKHLLEYDDVMNQQRQVVYEYRRKVLDATGLRDLFKEFVEEVAEGIVDSHIDEKTDSSEWGLEDLNENLEGVFGITIDASSGNMEALTECIVEDSWKRYEEKVENVGDTVMSEVEKMLMLITIDNLWKDHLLTMDHLKGGIGLRGYGQKNPLNEYKREGFELFAEMLFRMKGEVTERLFKVKVEPAGAADTITDIRPKEQAMTYGRDEVASAQSQGGDGEGQQRAEKQRPVRRAVEKVGRNEPCPCGSGKKYKKCCDKDNS